MNYIYLAAVQEEPNGKFYPLVIRIGEDKNVISYLRQYKGLQYANICPTKKQAVKIVEVWRSSYKQNGSYAPDFW